MRNELHQAWGTWLTRYPWESWGTLTLKYDNPTPEQLTRAWNRFIGWLHVQGNPGVTYFVGHETGPLGRSHMHCLIGGLHPDTSRRTLWSWWFQRYGRAEIRGYDPDRGAAFYIGEYVVKELAHYDLDLDGFDPCLSAESQHQIKLGTPSWKRTRVTRGSVQRQLEHTRRLAFGPSSTASAHPESRAAIGRRSSRPIYEQSGIWDCDKG